MAEFKGSGILIIDDDEDMLQMLDAVLTLDEFAVTQCSDPKLAVRVAEDVNPDIILLDMMMPEKSGLEVMMEIRSNPLTRQIPILFLSAVGDEAIVVKALKGADDYVIKPFKTLELVARITKILERASRSGSELPFARSKRLQRLPVQRGDETFLVPLAEISYFEAAGKYSYAHTKSKRFLTGFSLGQLEDKLEDGNFIRLHRSHIVNIDFVRKVTKDKAKGTLIVLADEKETKLKVSDSHLPAVKARLGL